MHIPVNPVKSYSPKEIASHKFILNQLGKSDYRYILELINGGKLKAKCTTQGNRKFYEVLGADILHWEKSTYNIPKQSEKIVLEKNEKKPFPQPYDNTHS